MSLAERAREEVRTRPFLHESLRAGVLNYSATAAYLDIGDESAVAAALRRYAGELDSKATVSDARVRMESGLGRSSNEGDPLLVVGETTLVPDSGSLTAVIATGYLSVGGLREVIGRCDVAGIDPEAVGFDGETLLVAVVRRDGPDMLRIVEDVFKQ